MKTSTFIRYALLAPIVLPVLAWLVPVAGIASLGLIFTVGLMYYGAGYVIFAVAVLLWLRRPRSDDEIRRATAIAPALAAPLLAASVVLTGLVLGTGGRDGVSEFLGMTAIALAAGYFYAGLTLLVGDIVAFSARRNPTAV